MIMQKKRLFCAVQEFRALWWKIQSHQFKSVLLRLLVKHMTQPSETLVKGEHSSAPRQAYNKELMKSNAQVESSKIPNCLRHRQETSLPNKK